MPRHSVRIDFYRHSYALYGPFKPDLTPEGIELAERVAESIVAEADPQRLRYLRIVSSPKVRALGTADIICKALGIPPGEIQQESDLSDYLVHDLEERNRILVASSPDRDFHRGWDMPYYAGDPLQDVHPEIFETRKSVAHRAFRWLGRQFQDYHDGRLHSDILAVSHAEVINLVLKRFAGDDPDPLHQCERLRLELQPSENIGMVRVSSSFRDVIQESEFETPAAAFSQQFGTWM